MAVSGWLRSVLGRKSQETGPVAPMPPPVSDLAAALAAREAEAEQARKAGNQALASGDLSAALGHYERMAELRPSLAAAHINRGYVLMKVGRYDQAASAMRLAESLDPTSFEPPYFLASCLRESGDLKAAVEASRRASVLEPNNFAVWMQLADLQEKTRAFKEAQDAYGKANSLNLADVAAVESLSRVALYRKDYDVALGAVERLLGLVAEPSKVANALGIKADILKGLGRVDDAWEAIDRALKMEPNNASLWRVLGHLQLVRRLCFDALGSFERALDLDGQQSTLASRSGLSLALADTGRIGEAIQVVEEMLREAPDEVDLRHNHAVLLMQDLRHEDAVASLRRGLQVVPDHEQLCFDLGMALLAMGQFEEGWQRYESRLLLNPAAWPTRWPINANIAGSRTLLFSEQGLGDTIHFIRYARLVLNKGAKVTIQVHERIAPLLEMWRGQFEIITRKPSLEEFDFLAPLPSLPSFLAIEPLEIPVPYVVSKVGRKDYWRSRLASDSRPKIGIVWCGNPQHLGDRYRSMRLESMMGLDSPALQFISLQFDVPDVDTATLERWSGLVPIGRDQQDMADTAALIETLDAVVCVDTSVAHLAGALGAPLYLLLAYNPDWRWGLHGDTTPWYPSARLYRQDDSRRWEPVIDRVREDLLARFARPQADPTEAQAH